MSRFQFGLCKCPGTGSAEENLAQILRGTAKAKFYSLCSEQLRNLSKADQFEVPNCQV